MEDRARDILRILEEAFANLSKRLAVTPTDLANASLEHRLSNAYRQELLQSQKSIM